MEGELIKRKDRWDLYNKSDGSKIASTAPNPYGKLSLKNCQAIELGYDLENMADFYGAKAKGSVDFKLGANQGFEDGFQKALEILGDKKFSEDEITKAIDFGVQIEAGNIDIDYKKYGTPQNQFIQSLQQTEFSVEIVMEDSIGIGDKYTPDTKPKLDENSCLILKHKI